jgi:hypothetical protein
MTFEINVRFRRHRYTTNRGTCVAGMAWIQGGAVPSHMSHMEP